MIPALLGLIFATRGAVGPGGVFVALSLPIGLFVVAYSFGYAPFRTLTVGDSYTYALPVLTGDYHPIRNSGYPTFLLWESRAFGFRALPLVQLAIQIACYAIAVWLMAFGSRRIWLGTFLLAAIAVQGWMTIVAPFIQTEALFTAGLTLFAGGLAASVLRPSTGALVSASLGLAIAIAAKSIGVVLVVPALMALRFIPKGRLRAAAVLVAPSVAVYVAMSAHAYHRTGSLAPESAAGYSLAGHIVGMLDLNLTDRPDVVEAIRTAIAPVLAKRPADLLPLNSRSRWEAYVDQTTSENAQILWPLLRPAMSPYISGEPEQNEFLLRLSLASIAIRPYDYARHVAAHFYGMWRHLADHLFYDLRFASIHIRHYLTAPEMDRLFGPALDAPPSAAELQSWANAQSNVPLAIVSKVAAALRWLLRSLADTVWLGFASLILSVLFLTPGRITWAYRAEIMLALSLNAYFLGHALLQSALSRYSAVALPVALMLLLSLIATTFRLASRRTQIWRYSHTGAGA
jgi:hypothetical protein